VLDLSFCLSRKIKSYSSAPGPLGQIPISPEGPILDISCFHILGVVFRVFIGWHLAAPVDGCRSQVLTWCLWSSWSGLFPPALGCGGILSVEWLVVPSLLCWSAWAEHVRKVWRIHYTDDAPLRAGHLNNFWMIMQYLNTNEFGIIVRWEKGLLENRITQNNTWWTC